MDYFRCVALLEENGNNVKADCSVNNTVPAEIVLSHPLQLLLFVVCNRFVGLTELQGSSCLHLQKDKTVCIFCDNIYFPRLLPVIALQDSAALCFEMLYRQLLSLFAKFDAFFSHGFASPL